MLPSDPKLTLDLFLLALAVWRLANLITGEDGPGNIFGRLRGWLIDPARAEIPGTLSKGLSCPYCVSVWLSLIATACYLASASATRLGAFPLAMAGIVAYLQKQTYDRSVEFETPLPPDPPDFLDG